ncbi:ABC transporter ATP-binding protein [Alicyclobacillaceae bacterium I2511]|nr:ABC transporter ATP-binding protein [Alicyclobacillaceae bacterium I2511]
MSSLLRLLPYARPYLRQFILVLGLVVVYNATSVLQPYLVKVAIDRDIVVTHPSFHGLLQISLLYIAVVVLGTAANYFQILTLQYAGQSIIRHIRLDLFHHITAQSMDFFDRNAIGRLVTNVSSDTETVSQFFTNFFLSLIRDGLAVVMIVFAMFQLDAAIAAKAMVLLPLLFGISLLFRKRLRQAYQATRTHLANVIAFLAENLAGVRITQIFHQEMRQARKFEQLNKLHRQANIHEYQTSVLFNRTFEMLGNMAVAAVVWIGGNAVLHHAIEFGTLYAFISYIRNFFQPINSMTQQWNTLQSSMVSADRIGRVLSVEPGVQDAPNPVHIAPTKLRGQVVFEHVSFGYQPNQPVLQDICLVAKPGSFIGLVGPTGAGKSSIMSLLTRFYDPDVGRILLDGVDLRMLAQADLHHLVGIVQQEVYLFSGTVADNIRLFRDDISDQQVRAAAAAVGAHRVIEKLPQQYQTWLYGKGGNLSMGERQLLSFARIVALDQKVLILDEATANLDSQTEALVTKGLQAVAKNRTTLVIAHRLATIRHADKIYFLQQGRIVEQGTHEQLLSLAGLYAELYAKSGIEHPDESTVFGEIGKTR